MNNGIFLLLGSNQGDPLQNLRKAAREIDERAGKIIRRSSCYKTAAWGISEQPEFYNQVLEIASVRRPELLLEELLLIEQEMGRVRVQKWGPRMIDIDILFYGSEIVDTPDLKIPHPGIPDRRFTLVPLGEIAPDWQHPVMKKSIAELLEVCEDKLPVERLHTRQD
jgi:2-amino-4-hydroxy-6-hydroxymethyldihydropteridine diphosphokinase